MMAIDCPEYGPEIVFKGGTRQMTSPDFTTVHAAPAGHLVMRYTSRSRQPPFAHKRRCQSRVLTASRASVTRARRALATLRVQRGYRRSRDICNTYQNKYVKTELESPFLMYSKAIHNTRNETNHRSANNTFFFF